MWRSAEGSTARLVQLCLAYFCTYVLFGVATKQFTGNTAVIEPAMTDMAFLVWSTVGGSAICLAVIFGLGWYRGQGARPLSIGPMQIPSELAYILPSGLCAAIVIPTTTLLYMLLKSVMVAMVVMRASVIVVSRFVDEAQIRQGILHKRVFWEENVAVVFAIAAACSQLLLAGPGELDLIDNHAAMAVLSAYVAAYALRIYLMNYYKNTRPPGTTQNNQWYFSWEQLAASCAMVIAAAVLYGTEATSDPVRAFQAAVAEPHPAWNLAVGAGAIYGLVAFFSVFIFMFKGRTATFAGLVNRITSLVAGTTATGLTWLLFGGRAPSPSDWASLALIFVAVGFLTRAERRRGIEALPVAPVATAPPTQPAGPRVYHRSNDAPTTPPSP